MYELLKGKKEVTGKRSKKKLQAASAQLIVWTDEMQATVKEIIDYLKSPEFLVFPDYDIPFTLNCDASEKGLGAVLYQKQGVRTV